MNGIHDLGGMRGFGPIEVEHDEPVFHEEWEALAYALNALGLSRLRAYNVDEYRHSIERMDPARYLSASYYERVLTGVATLLVEKGVVTREELERRADGAFPLSRPVAERPTVELEPQPHSRCRPTWRCACGKPARKHAISCCHWRLPAARSSACRRSQRW